MPAQTAGPGVVALTLSLMGGELLEDQTNRGVSRLAAEAWEDWFTSTLDEPGGVVSVHVGSTPDSIQLRITGQLENLASAVRLAAGALADPQLDDQAIERNRRQLLDEIDSDARSGRAALGLALVDAVFPAGEARVRPLARETVETLTPDAARAWLGTHARTAPIEVGIAGDVTLEQGLSLGSALLGQVPGRDRVRSDWLSEKRLLTPAAGPIVKGVDGVTPAGMALVVAGFVGVDASSTGEFRSLRAASRVLDERVRARLLDAGLIEGNASTGSALMYSPYPGFGMILLSSVVPDLAAEDASVILRDEIDRLTIDGPTPDELATATDALALEARSSDADPVFWSRLLSRSTIASLDPNKVVAGDAFYLALTPQDVQSVLTRKWTPTSRISLIVHERPGTQAGDAK